jgi:hypothetical protein
MRKKIVLQLICMACAGQEQGQDIARARLSSIPQSDREEMFGFVYTHSSDTLSHASHRLALQPEQKGTIAFKALATLLLASPPATSFSSWFLPAVAPVDGRPSSHLLRYSPTMSLNNEKSHPQGMSRRALFGASALAAGLPKPAQASFVGAEWPLWPALPLAPYGKRKTVMQEAVPGCVWTFEQLFGVFYVHVPIRMTVMKLDSGGLFVYAPIAPTKECLALLKPLIDANGPIKYIVLPPVAPEHKVLAGPFARNFPQAELYTTDRQYAFPLNLPGQWLGFPSKVNVLPASSSGKNLFGGEFEFEIITAKASKESVYQDAAFFHKSSKTLLLCDALVSTSPEPPPILLSEPEYRRALLYHARDDPLEKVEDTPEVRRKGWERIVLFANFFMPGSLRLIDNAKWLAAAPKTPMPELGWGGALPFTWSASTAKAFKAFSAGGKPVVVPIIQIIFSRAPQAAMEWVNKVAAWDFQRVIPAHFDAPIAMGRKEFEQAFDFLVKGKNEVRFCDEDVLFLREALEGLPPNLALFDTPLGSLRGNKCNL